MAAASSDLGRNRVAGSGFRPTRGLYLIFSLLCLVGLANSLLEMDTLEKLKEELRNIKQKAESVKEDYESKHSVLSEVMNENERYVNAMLALMERGPPEFKSQQAFFESIKAFSDTIKTFMDGVEEHTAARFENLENKLESTKELLKSLEEDHDEF
ncbi:uncharacterized protein LOC139917386 [Centroberyx gerrardi]